MSSDFWGDRYTQEGFIWGVDPSLTAEFLVKALPASAAVFEIGFGYGRDLMYLGKAGHQVHGIEKSPIALHKAQDHLTNHGIQAGHLMQGDFTSASLPANTFDAAYSHRTLHLLQEEKDITRFVEQAAHIIKPGGLLFISARDNRGELPTRKGHHVSFWDEERFEKTFGDQFEIIRFVQGNEIESASNPKQTYFTLMIARKKPDAPNAPELKNGVPSPAPSGL